MKLFNKFTTGIKPTAEDLEFESVATRLCVLAFLDALICALWLL